MGWDSGTGERDLLSPPFCLILTFFRRNNVNYLRIFTPDFEELGPKLEGTVVTNRVHTPYLPAENEQKALFKRVIVMPVCLRFR